MLSKSQPGSILTNISTRLLCAWKSESLYLWIDIHNMICIHKNNIAAYILADRQDVTMHWLYGPVDHINFSPTTSVFAAIYFLPYTRL